MRYRKDLLIASCYTLLTIILTYPLSLRLAGQIAGFKGEDNLQWRWFLWWFKHSILSLQTAVTNLSLLYAPTGGEQPLYAISALTPALALPATLLGGPTISFNLSFLLSFVLTGYTTYLLAYYLTRHRLAGFIAGLIFAFYPARFGYATGLFLGQLTVYLLPVYVMALLMLLRRPNRRRAIWAAVVLAGLCLTWPLHVAYGVVVFTIPILAWQIFSWLRHPQSRTNIKYFILAFGLAFGLIIGPYLPLLESVLQGKNDHLGDSDSVNFALDVLAFVSPSNYHPILQPLNLLPDYATHVLADRDDIHERLAYLGLVPVFLTLLGLLKFRKKLLLWLLIALAAMVLSLGPLLKFDGNLLRVNIEGYVGYIVLPYALLYSLPILNWSETLGRMNTPTMLCLAIMAAYGATYLLANVKNNWRLGLVAILSILILSEYVTIFPFPTEPGLVPDFYYRLGQEGQITPQKIIDLPLTIDPSHNNYSMHYQTVHQQAIAGGHFIRKPAAASEMTSFLHQLLSPPLSQNAFDFPDPQNRLRLLNQFGFTKVVARSWLMTEKNSISQLAYLRSWLGQPHPEGEVFVFEVPQAEVPWAEVPQAEESPRLLTSLLDGDGWQIIENSIQLQSPSNLLVYLNSNQPQLLAFQLSLSAPTPDRYLTIDLDGRPAIRLYLSTERLDYHIPFNLPAGIHRFTFRPEEACLQNCEPVNFNSIALNSLEADSITSISFANQLSLIKHNISSTTTVPGQPILIYLYWQSQTQLTENYSAFVHLVSPSGQLIAQADYLLGGWLYPTTRWPSKHITATPTLFFVPPDTPPGEYQLLAGLYHTETGDRLLLDVVSEPKDSAFISKIIVNP